MEELADVYSRALFEVAKEHGKLDSIHDELNAFVDALEGHRDLAVFLFSPYFSTQEKEDGLARVIDGGDEELMNFLRLLIEKHRMPVIYRIRTAFHELWEQDHRLLPVEITSAIELDPATVEEIGKQIGERTKRNVQLTARVDPDILGGLIVRVGNAILDASISNRLEHLRRSVASGVA